MNLSLLIYNLVPWHYEIIESVIVNFKKIITDLDTIDDNKIIISLLCIPEESFIKYISSKYPKLLILNPKQNIEVKSFKYKINCTLYEKDLPNIELNSKTHYYISHEITNKVLEYDNIFYLSELSKKNIFHATILPFSELKKENKKDTPIFVIQGSLNKNRRNYDLLLNILNNVYWYDYKIKLLGKLENPPNFLSLFEDKLIFKCNLNFQNYHQELLDCHCILPLISKDTHPQYYNSKLTSSINYAKGYNLKCLIDKNLQDIYQLNNVEVYVNDNDIIKAFNNILREYYTIN